MNQFQLDNSNTIKVSRELASKLQSMILTPGRCVHVPSKGDWIDNNGKACGHYVIFDGGDLERFTVFFKSRKELCDYLRNKISGK